MSYQATTWVLERSNSTLGSRLVLLSIASHADRLGENSWPDIATIAREARLCRSQVFNCIENLKLLGELEVHSPTHGERRWKGKNNTYRLPLVRKMIENIEVQNMDLDNGIEVQNMDLDNGIEVQSGGHRGPICEGIEVQSDAKNETVSILNRPIENSPIEQKNSLSSGSGEPDLFGESFKGECVTILKSKVTRLEIASVSRVFAYFVEKIGKSPSRYTLTDGRKVMAIHRLRELIRRANGSTAKERRENAELTMKYCVDDMAASDFHQGKNKQGKKWLEWELLWRSTEQMEKWL